ncbi:hypothetical protein BO70DRAFT_396715 [Aspergillus heteromorphus CBS 117.55]|uniref:Uncharacterized protein n=1 Tax=Aspergillus heteromorphus CBS 117.55 TaxID=1448321 RepID=A0A317W896_9EURO|nr:uncharacterized protein BO70DRAFT_396715 [Aspergillus heteromorphus CBS 117.55]PWY81931.1 hypothetical protein BO70DRAFT_396715 [Aspergillus heteromorphus CBS 117.55]
MPCFKASMASFLLACMAFSSITQAYPVPASQKASALTPRSPREMPNSNSNDLVSSLFNTVGLSDLNKLNHWKEDNESDDQSSNQPDVIDDSKSATPTQTEQNNTDDKAGDVQTTAGDKEEKRKPTPSHVSHASATPSATPGTASPKTNKNNKGEKDDENRFPNPAQNPAGFVSALMRQLQHTIDEALDSKDEHTLN